jgi:sulfur-carrier protein adenylyltransferase/sulfurtransferase
MAVVPSHEEKCEWARRYSRQMLVPQLGGVQGQFHLSRSKVLIVGAGGIGSTAILYLAGAGVGQIDVLDFDLIEESNLHRQIIHSQAGAQAKQSKAESACQRVLALNPQIQARPLLHRLTAENAKDLLMGYDAVVDATDNYDARYAISDACVALAIPLVSGSAGQSSALLCSALLIRSLSHIDSGDGGPSHGVPL